MPTVIPVGGAAPYDVVVGHRLASRVPGLLSGAGSVLTVADASVRELAVPVVTALREAGVDAPCVEIAPGEQAKALETVTTLWDELGRLRLTRNDALVSVGGGATTDVVGFAAATWLRGVRVVHVPTTLLGMVDAAVGGKTGINTTAGKNLVGAFHPPAGVLVDLETLETLPDRQWVNGLAEVVKAGFIADPAILELLERDPATAGSAATPVARELVERSIRMKAVVVTADLHEAGVRESLNYGHTLGHAIERREDYRMPHGHAVAIGMVFAAELGRAVGRLDDATATRHRDVLAAVGLPTRYAGEAWPDLLEIMRLDKKARGSLLRFVVLDGLARPGILEGPDPALLEAAYREVAR